MWPRPVPLVGDASAARERAHDPAGWAFPVEQRDALMAVLAARRDVRRFRPDDVEPEVLARVLGAAHLAPSVGHSQPWRFVVVREAETRERAALLADRARLAQAEQMDPDAARRLLDLQLEGIREAPAGVVVCCDRRVPAPGVLGRATFPDADLWSCACAIQNLWLAARAEGLGVGWVTLFEPEDLAGLLHLPDGVVTLGWLCLGWPDERPPEPGLVRAGWSERVPLDDVVFSERWPRPGQPQPASPPSRLRAPDQSSVVTVRDRADELLGPPGSLGVLDRAVDRVLALTDRRPGGGALVLVGADHPVTRHGVSAYPTTVTGDVLRAAVAGQAMGTVAAAAAGLTTTVVDAGVGDHLVAGAVDVRPHDLRGDLVTADALSEADVRRLLDAGVALGRRAAESGGPVALGEVGIGNTTIAAALTAAVLDLDAADVVGLGAGADSAMLDRKRHVVTAARRRAERHHGRHLAEPLTVLRSLGGPELVVLCGVTLGAAEGGAAVVLDGLATGVAALVATRLEPGVAAHVVAGHRSREAAHPAVLRALGVEPLLDLRIRAGEGVAACLAVGLINDALTVRRETGRTAARGAGPGP
jgi:nicotinate-nucleotide--dimethylbenzimidazole phosphoribosyltransferase